jgi:hypothetical protein
LWPPNPSNLFPLAGAGDVQGIAPSSHTQWYLDLEKFCYACETYGAPPDLDMFCTFYELQRQPKRAKVSGVDVEYQFASCAFMAKRA